MKLKNEHGFSLVELATVLIIFGMISSAIVFGFKTYTEQARLTKTKESLRDSIAVITRFEALNPVFPCPARLDLGPSDANYGLSVTGAAIDTYSRQGRHDLDGDGINEDYVYGAVPINEITTNVMMNNVGMGDFTPKDGLDGWNNKLLYVVSRHLCDTTYTGSNAAVNIAGHPEGVLDIVTEATCVSASSGNDVPQSVLPGDCEDTNRRYAQFVVLSHGPNGRGAYTKEGNNVQGCIDTAAALPPADPGLGPLSDGDWFNNNASDRKNCKFDLPEAGRRLGEFYSGLRNEDQDEEYDDYVKFSYKDEYQIFATAASIVVPESFPGAGDGYEIARMKNVNAGEIGIGLQDPEELLHVNGDLQALDIHAAEYCADIDTDKCMGSDVLTTTGLGCTTGGEAIQSIEDNTATCADPFAGRDFTCPLVNERLKTVRSDGTFECCDPTVAIPVCNWY